MAKKTMMLSELIEFAQKIYGYFGDLPVYLQQDTEGNGYATLKKEDSFWAEQDEKDGKKALAMIIQPFEENLDYDELFDK